MGQKQTLEDSVFEMRLASKQMVKESQRSEKEEAKEKLKVKAAIEKGVLEAAQIHAENAIRKKHEALNYLKLSSKMDSVASKLQTMSRTQNLTKQFSKIIPQMKNAMQSMNMEKIASTMNEFETMFENLDVVSEHIDVAIGQTVSTATPAEEVNKLIAQVADEHNLKVGLELPGQVSSSLPQQQQQVQNNNVNDFEARLNNLRG